MVLKNILSRIESKRNSGHGFYKFLVKLKDGLWKLIYSKSIDLPTNIGNKKTYPLFYLLFFAVLESLKHRKNIQRAKTFAFFIGYPRSGHSIIGSLLDAHPQVVFAHELGFMNCKFFNRLLSFNLIAGLIIKNSSSYKENQRRKCGGYQYWVPTKSPGVFSNLTVVGDKCGSEFIRTYQADSKIFSKIQKRFNRKIKILHVIRNPFDNISTHVNRVEVSVKEAVDFYFNRVEKVLEIKNKSKDFQIEICDIYHEEFVSNLRSELARICTFLGVEADESYLNDCAEIVYKTPNKSRFTVEWSDAQVEEVSLKLKNISYLRHYSYQD